MWKKIKTWLLMKLIAWHNRRVEKAIRAYVERANRPMGIAPKSWAQVQAEIAAH